MLHRFGAGFFDGDFSSILGQKYHSDLLGCLEALKTSLYMFVSKFLSSHNEQISQKIFRKILINHQKIKFSISFMSAATLLGQNLV